MFLPLFDYLERPLLRKNCCKNRLKNVAIQIFAPPFFLQRGKQKHSFLVDNNANFAKYSNPMLEGGGGKVWMERGRAERLLC